VAQSLIGKGSKGAFPLDINGEARMGVAFFLRLVMLHIWKAANSLAFESKNTITKLSICNTFVKEFPE
jgi:hypothetical protein